MMSYAAAVETGAGLATVVLGSEETGTVSTIEALHMADVS